MTAQTGSKAIASPKETRGSQQPLSWATEPQATPGTEGRTSLASKRMEITGSPLSGTTAGSSRCSAPARKAPQIRQGGQIGAPHQAPPQRGVKPRRGDVSAAPAQSRSTACIAAVSACRSFRRDWRGKFATLNRLVHRMSTPCRTRNSGREGKEQQDVGDIHLQARIHSRFSAGRTAPKRDNRRVRWKRADSGRLENEKIGPPSLETVVAQRQAGRGHRTI